MQNSIIDKDLQSIQQARDLAGAAKQAYNAFANFSQKEVDGITKAMANAGINASARLAKLAVEETGYGNKKDKTAKNIFATKGVYDSIKDLKTVGVINRDDADKIIEIAHPMGVIAAVTPTTNPTSTVMFKSLISVKSRNGIVFAPHPNALQCSREAVLVMSEAAQASGAPRGLISCLDTVTLEGTTELMKNLDISLILATGGTSMVRAAHSFGKPAIGVGPGNVPAYVDRSADLEKAAKDIIASKTFDNGVICASEQAIVVHSQVEHEFKKAVESAGGYFLDPDQVKKVSDLMVHGNAMNPDMVGKTPQFIAAKAEITIPETTKLLIAPLGGVGPDFPLSREILSTIIAYYIKDNWKDACELCMDILKFEGLGHTLAIHSLDEEVITAFAHEKPAFRILINTPTSQGAVGLTTSLAPSMTLSTGSWGGGIYSDNISAKHLLNIKRVAYETSPLNESSNHKAISGIARDDVETIVRKVVGQLKV